MVKNVNLLVGRMPRLKVTALNKKNGRILKYDRFHDYAKAFLICRGKLPEKPQIIFKIQSEVIYHIFEHGNPFNAHPECIPGKYGTVNTTVFEYVGVNHTATHDLNPASSLANIASFTFAERAGDINFSTGLSEGEVGWPEPD